MSLIMFEEILAEIGLDQKEISIYTCALSLGPQAASVLAKKTGIKRPTTYLILKRLIEKHYIKTHHSKQSEIFTAISPDLVLEKLKKDQEERAITIKNFATTLPKINLSMNAYIHDPKVSFFSGVDGIIQVMEDTLKSKGEILSYSNMEGWFKDEKLSKYIIDYGIRRVKKIKIPLRSIDVDTPEIRAYLEKQYPRGEKWTKTKWLHKHILPFDNEINIYDDKVAICSLEKNEQMGIIIKSKSISKTLRSIFEQAWENAKPGKSYGRAPLKKKRK